MKRVVGLFVCIIVLLGCNKEENTPLGEGVFTNHFISSFCDANTINMVQYYNDGNVFMIYASPDDCFSDYKYQTLCHQFGDISYNRMVSQDPTITMCYANLFTSIDITSSVDFGDIKAGESLSDIVVFRGASAKTYIDNGYLFPSASEYRYAEKEMMEELGNRPWDFTHSLHGGFYPCVKRLSELTSEDLTLLSCNFMSIRFVEVPDIKEHTLTIVFRTQDKEVRGQFDVVFP